MYNDTHFRGFSSDDYGTDLDIISPHGHIGIFSKAQMCNVCPRYECVLLAVISLVLNKMPNGVN